MLLVKCQWVLQLTIKGLHHFQKVTVNNTKYNGKAVGRSSSLIEVRNKTSTR